MEEHIIKKENILIYIILINRLSPHSVIHAQHTNNHTTSLSPGLLFLLLLFIYFALNRYIYSVSLFAFTFLTYCFVFVFLLFVVLKLFFLFHIRIFIVEVFISESFFFLSSMEKAYQGFSCLFVYLFMYSIIYLFVYFFYFIYYFSHLFLFVNCLTVSFKKKNGWGMEEKYWFLHTFYLFIYLFIYMFFCSVHSLNFVLSPPVITLTPFPYSYFYGVLF